MTKHLFETLSKRYSQSMKPQDMAKVAEAQAEFDHYDKVLLLIWKI